MLKALLLGACFTSRLACAHPPASVPAQFSTVACYQLVQEAGRPIAWARWERRLPVEKTRTAPFRDGTPEWVTHLVSAWIDDAYAWRASNEQVRQWALEMGSSENLPSAEQLSVHETIAIWLRRIARGCQAGGVQANS